MKLSQMAGVSVSTEQSLGLCSRAWLGRVKPGQSLTLSVSPCLTWNFQESENFNLNIDFQVIIKVSFFLVRNDDRTSFL